MVKRYLKKDAINDPHGVGSTVVGGTNKLKLIFDGRRLARIKKAADAREKLKRLTDGENGNMVNPITPCIFHKKREPCNPYHLEV